MKGYYAKFSLQEIIFSTENNLTLICLLLGTRKCI